MQLRRFLGFVNFYRRFLQSCAVTLAPLEALLTSDPARLALAAFLPPDDWFDHIHIDLVGPLPPCQGHKYIFTIIDGHTRWPEAVPVPDSTTPTLATALISAWITRFCAPSVITTDHRSQFESALFASLTNSLGTRRIRTRAYHSVANGLLERFHRQLKVAPRAIGSTPLPETFPITLLNPVPDSTLDYLFRLRRIMANLHPTPTHSAHFSSGYHHPDLSACNYAFLRLDAVKKPLQPSYTGPIPIVQKNPHYFTISIDGQQDTISLHRLKPAYLEHSCSPPSLSVQKLDNCCSSLLLASPTDPLPAPCHVSRSPAVTQYHCYRSLPPAER
ncbi:uncharacterized protein LOC135396302 [Ornithodoros turicata]|uniref:uncharacterized protein LOC135396302 n=1 Tax=Ornithodoros turicata TaxID=34597 RepID=UPI00313A034D